MVIMENEVFELKLLENIWVYLRLGITEFGD